MSSLRRAAEFAEKLAVAGCDAWYIVQELNHAADAEEFGWTGTKHFGTDAGLIPPSEADGVRYAIDRLIEANPRAKTVSKTALTEAMYE